MSLQNLKEDALYQKLPEGVITLDERSILRALLGGVQDRLEDIRSYAKKFEVLFTSDGIDNTVVIAQFDTGYGKTVTRSLDIQADTPSQEGYNLTVWAAEQMGVDTSQIVSCVFGEDLLRYVDAPVLQMLAMSIGAVLYQTSAQTGSDVLNQQKILNSYFPRLKIKGTAMSFDILGKLIGFDDVRMTPLWGRLSPRAPSDIGDPANDADFTQTPDYYPQQATGVAYDPHVFRDGPYFTWTGTVSADPTSTNYYTQTVNGFQPWVKVAITGSVIHPAIGDTVTLAGGSPHTKATADAGQGLTFQALGEGEDFNGLQVTFTDWNSGTDRLVSITDRLSAVKYRTSYFDLALTLTDEHAIQQFGTTTAKPNSDLQANPALAEGRTASSPYRPWRGGQGDSHSTFEDFTWVTSGTTTPITQRTQATTALSQSQFKTDEIQAAGQEAVQIMDEVRAATRFPRRSSVGFLDKDGVAYAAQTESYQLFEMDGTSTAEGIASYHPAPGYAVDVRVRNATALRIQWQTEVGYRYYIKFSNDLLGPYVRISDYYTGDGGIAEFFLVIGAGAGFDFIIKEYWNGTAWVAVTPPSPVYTIMSISFPLKSEMDPLSNGTLVRFSDGVFFNGTYDLDQHWYRFDAMANHHSISGAGLIVDAYWTATNTEVVRSDPSPVPVTQVFAAFGDNTDNNNSYQVGTMVASWEPEFLLMLGDHNYDPTRASYPDENRPFLPWINDGKAVAVPGNHDLDIENGKGFYDFFKQDRRYYDRRIGNVHVFAIDTGINTASDYIYPDWQGQLAEPARWLKEAMSASQAPWKIVILHHDPYISTNSAHGDYDKLKWPFKDWGADLVLFGHVHAYEHLYVEHPTRGNDGIHMICAGWGGKSLASFTGSALWGSVYRYPISPQTPKPGAVKFSVTATSLTWWAYSTDGTLHETVTLTKDSRDNVYQARPEDEAGVELIYEVVDEFPWRRDLVGNGELVEINSRIPPVVDDVSTTQVSSTVAIKDHTGADYTVYGLNSSVRPIRFAASANAVDKTYQPGQLAIAYKGSFIDLLDVVVKRTDIDPGFFTDAETYTAAGFSLYHAGLVQGVLVADPVSFYGPHHRSGLRLWLPFNEHPDEGAILVDHAASAAESALTGFTLVGSFANRVWDDSVGWNLYVKNAAVQTTGVFDIGPAYAMSMWINPDTANGTEQQTLFNHGPLAIALNGTNNTAEITYVNVDGSRNQVATFVVTPGTFAQIAVSIQDNHLHYGLADKATSLSLSTGTLPDTYQPFNGTHTDVSIDCPDRGVSFHDLRVWNRAKTEAELDKVRDYSPVPTICTYWPTNIDVAGNGDRYGMRVLDNGFITPDQMPPALRLNQLARVVRYTDEGRYEGENRFNEVGLGGGSPLPPTWLLGQQFYDLTSTGTIAFCTSIGGGPYNALWQFAGSNSYVGLPFSGSTATGIEGSGTTYTSAAWPPPMDFNNPAHEFIWIKGDDGKVYEVSLRSTTTSAEMVGSLVVRQRSDDELALNGALKVVTAEETTPHGSWDITGTAWVTFDNGTFDPAQVLVQTNGTHTVSFSPASKGVAVLTDNLGEVKVYHPQEFRYIDQPTGAVSILTANGTELTCNYGGQVYCRATSGTLNTPPLYMYLPQRKLEDTSTPATTANSVWGRWTDHTDAALYGNTLDPQQAALDDNGVMEFENTSDLIPGHYRLTIESGAIGRVDQDFDGFSVVLTIDTVRLEARLLSGLTGADFTGTDVFEFDYSGYNSDNWLLTVQYLNALADAERGTQRHLALRNYKLERITTELYQISVTASTSPVITSVQTGTYTGTNPGGWLAIVNSYGTVARVVHESAVFPANDTIVSYVPLSSLLTSNTWQRREDHYVAGSSLSVLPDDAAVAMPTFDGILVR